MTDSIANFVNDAGKTMPLALADNGDGTYTLKSVQAAGTSYIGTVGGNSTYVTATINMTVASGYVTGDYVGVSATSLEIPNVGKIDGGSGLVVAATLHDKAKQSVAGELWLFDAAVTPPADSAAWSISDADMLHFLGVIPFSTYYASALNSVSQIETGRLGFKCAAASKSIWGCYVTRGSPVYTSGDLVLRLFISQEV
jgi:hypothetical protein